MNESTPPEDKRRTEESPPADADASSEPAAMEDAASRDEPPAEPSADVPAPVLDEPVADQSIPETEGQRETDAGPADAPGPVRTGRGVAIFALIVALAAAAGSGYLGWMAKVITGQADAVRADLSGELGRIEAGVAGLRQSLDEIERQRRTDTETVDRLSGAEGRLERRIEALETRTAALAKTQGVPREADWRAAEVEFLLRLANRQAALARDPVGARAALENADALLTDMADPAMQPVRQQLADDILSLRSFQQPDVEGLALRLGSLARRVASLPLASQPVGGNEPSSGPAPDSGWQRFKAKVREFFASIFQVRRAVGDAAPLLSPEEAFFLRRNLELELQAARVALLRGNGPVYRASIGSARRWAEEHFLAADPGVRAFVDALGELEGRDISMDIPDVSGSLRVFAEVRAAEDS